MLWRQGTPWAVHSTWHASAAVSGTWNALNRQLSSAVTVVPRWTLGFPEGRADNRACNKVSYSRRHVTVIQCLCIVPVILTCAPPTRVLTVSMGATGSYLGYLSYTGIFLERMSSFL
ncbi:hypothetical protein L209DRAFT_269772 [Thermothelomyces heterothallicus CBS 203.75]